MSCIMSDDQKDVRARPGTPDSDRTSSTKKTHIQNEQTDVPDVHDEKQRLQLGAPYHTDAKDGEGESAIPEDRVVSTTTILVTAKF